MNPMQPVSNSEIQTWVRCRRKWFFQYLLWLAPPPDLERPAGNRELGFRIHQAFEAWFKSGQQHDLTFWLDEVYGAELLVHATAMEEVEAEHKLAKVMVEGYLEWAAETGLDEGVEIIAAERDVSVPMPGMPDVSIRGRLDQMIRRTRDGAILFRDWKTTGSLSAANDLPMSIQMKFYTMLQRLAGDNANVEGGQVVYLLRSKRTARATPPFYHLEEVRYNRDALNSVYLRTKSVLLDIIQARARHKAGFDHRDVFYASPGQDCSWSCPFYTMCPVMDDGGRWEDMTRDEFVQENPYSYYDRGVISDNVQGIS